MEPIANGHPTGAPPVRARDEETPRGSELAAGLFELLARDAQVSVAFAGPRAGEPRGALDAAAGRRSDAFARAGGGASEPATAALCGWLRETTGIEAAGMETTGASRHATPAGALDEPRARDDLAIDRNDMPARAAATRDASAADAGHGADAGASVSHANLAPVARGEKGTGDVGPHALAGAAGAAAGSGGSTGDSRGPRIDGSTEWAAPRSPSLTVTEGAGGAGTGDAGTGDQSGIDGRAAGATVAPAQPPATGDAVAALAFPALMSVDGATDPLAVMTASGALRASVRAQAMQALTLAIQSRSREAILTLDPPGLGRIRIHVRIADDVISARVSTERPEIGQMLRADRDLIRARFAEQGLRLETLVIERGNRAIDARPGSGDEARLALAGDGREGAARGSLHTGDAAAGDARDGDDNRAAGAAAAGDGPAGAAPLEDASRHDPRTGVDLRV
jgi:flagellar hook-length control protein FliK